jgi:hypothetical protein
MAFVVLDFTLSNFVVKLNWSSRQVIQNQKVVTHQQINEKYRGDICQYLRHFPSKACRDKMYSKTFILRNTGSTHQFM